MLHLVSTFAIKTDTKWLDVLLRQLCPERFACSIACMYGGGPMQQRFEQRGIPAFNLNAPRGLSPAGLWRLVALIRQIQPDIVHTHLLRADLYGGLAARLAGVPVTLSSQYALFPYARAVSRKCDGVLDRLCRTLGSEALAVCEAIREDLVTRVRWPAARTHTIRTGLDFDAWQPDPQARARLRQLWGVAPDAPLIMTVARLSREKGLGPLVQAADRVHRSHPDARFVLVGDGPLAGVLAGQIRSRGLQETVLLAGFHEDIPSVLSAADIFVLPSYSEGMPNAVLEAFAAGLPVIASAAGGLVEVIESERTGLLVPAGDASALALAVERLIEDADLAGRLARAGAAEARERYSVRKVAAQYEALYSSLITAAQSPGVSKAIVPAERAGRSYGRGTGEGAAVL